MAQSVASTEFSLDDVLRRCGDFHRFQWFHYFFLNLIEILAGMVSLYYVYGTAEPKHRCRLPSHLWPNDNEYNAMNPAHEIVLRQHIPIENGQWDSCHLFNVTIDNGSLLFCTDGWVFDQSVFGWTFTEEASLVCDAKPKKSWLATLVQVAGFSLLLLGVLTDRYGRKAVIIGIHLLLFITCLFLQIAMQWVPMSIDLKFALLLTNQFASGLILSSCSIVFVLLLELTTSRYRSLVGSIALSSFAFGGVLITLFAYLTRHWQKLLWTITACIACTLPYLIALPESPSYLYSTKQYSKLETLLRRVAASNGRTDLEWHALFKELLLWQSSHSVNEEKLTCAQKIGQIACHRTTTKLLLISCLLAFTSMLLYIKISYGLATLGISPYTDIVIGAVIEIVAYILAHILMSTRLGRKYSLMMFIGLTCLCVFLVPMMTKHSELATVITSQIGKFGISASLVTTWIYIAELFATSIRGTANGMASIFSRLGAIAAPIVDSSIGEQYLFLTFYVYGSIALLVLFSILFLPETKTMSLADTDSNTNNGDERVTVRAPSVNGVNVGIST